MGPPGQHSPFHSRPSPTHSYHSLTHTTPITLLFSQVSQELDPSTKVPADGSPGSTSQLVVGSLDLNQGAVLPAEQLTGKLPQVRGGAVPVLKCLLWFCVCHSRFAVGLAPQDQKEPACRCLEVSGGRLRQTEKVVGGRITEGSLGNGRKQRHFEDVGDVLYCERTGAGWRGEGVVPAEWGLLHVHTSRNSSKMDKKPSAGLMKHETVGKSYNGLCKCVAVM